MPKLGIQQWLTTSTHIVLTALYLNPTIRWLLIMHVGCGISEQASNQRRQYSTQLASGCEQFLLLVIIIIIF